MLFAFLFFSLVGITAGFIAGLFGIGGGVVIVPALLFAFAQQGMDPAVMTHMAIGTSLATIAVTGSSSAFGHWQRGAVAKALLARLLPGLIIGAILGGVLASVLPARRAARTATCTSRSRSSTTTPSAATATTSSPRSRCR